MSTNPEGFSVGAQGKKDDGGVIVDQNSRPLKCFLLMKIEIYNKKNK